MTDFKMKYQIVADAARAKAEVKSFDDLLQGAGSSLGSAFAGPAAIAAAGVAAIGTAAVGAGVALFNLTKTAADYGSTIFDASKKTGLTAESLSAMDFAAKQSGTSLEAITGGVAKFSKTVGDAADGSKEAAKKLKEFGLTPKEAIDDLDGALGKVFKRIIDAPPGIERMTLAQKAFGKSGAELLPFMDSFDGDLAKLIKKAKELGVTIDDDAARAADEFGDSLDTLNAQLAGVGRTIGTELMPTFTRMATGMTDWLSQNQGEIRAWAETLGTAFSGSMSLVSKFANLVRDNATWIRVGLGVASMGVSELSIRAGEAFGALVIAEGSSSGDSSGGAAGGGGRSRGSRNAGDDTAGPGKGGSKTVANKLPAFGSMRSLVISSGNKQWDSWFNQMGQRFGVDPNVLMLQAGAESSFKSGAVSPKGAKGFSQFTDATAERFGVNVNSVKDSIRGQAQYMSQLLSMFGGDYRKALAGYNAGEGAVQKYGGIPPYRETRGYVSKIQSQYNSRVRKGDGSGYGTFNFDAETEAALELEEQIKDGLQSMAADMVRAEEEASSERIGIREKEAAVAESILEGMVLRNEITERDAIERVNQLKIDNLEAEQAELQTQIPTKKNIQRLEEIRLELDDARLKKQNETLKTEKQITSEIEKQIAALTKKNERPSGLGHRETPEDRQKRMQLTTVGSGQEIGAMGQLHDYFVGEGNEAAIAGVDAMTQALDGMGQALGSVVQAWTLYGSAGASAQQVTAQILAGIAQQATVKAVFELAEGFAMLALAFFGHPGAGPSATQHFIAAGIYAGIAGGAAIVGRGVAGDSMKPGGSGSGGRGPSSNSGGNREQEVRPYSRQSDDVYISGRRGDAIHNLATEIRALRKMVSTASPGDVLVRGVKQRPGLIGRQTADDMKRNPTLGSAMLRRAGAR
jgi:hypothetical protein